MFVREELHRIDRLIAEPHFKVQVRARNPPGPAEIADILALLDLLAFPDSEFVQMGVTQDDAFSGINVDGQAIGAFTAAVYDLAGRGSNAFSPRFPAISTPACMSRLRLTGCLRGPKDDVTRIVSLMGWMSERAG